MKSDALVVTGLNEIEVGTIEVPAPQAGEVLVRIEMTGISAGTELRCLRGEQPGQPVFPFVPGYNGLGVIETVGEGVDLAIGTRVLSSGTARCSINRCWGGHCARHVAKAAGVIPVPDNVSESDALMVRLASISWRGVRLARPAKGEAVIVVGLGPIGQCSARLFQAAGAQVLGLDRAPQRVAKLEAQGIAARVVTGDLVTAGKAVFPQGAAIVVDASGAPPVALQAPDLLQQVAWDDEETVTPRYVVQGSYPVSLAFDYQMLFVREASVYFPRNSKRGDADTVLSLLQSQQIALGDIIEEITSPHAAPDVYRRLREGTLLTAAFRWEQGH